MRTPVALPHVDLLNHYLELDPSIPNGLRWKAKASRNTMIGQPAGRKHQSGYWEIRFDKILYKSSRIIYKIYNNGEDPGCYEIDHLDRDKDNNSGDNLILATKGDQRSNQVVSSLSGFRNVGFDKRHSRRLAPWISSVGHWNEEKTKKVSKFLGYYSNPYEASIVALAYKRSMGMRYEFAPGGTV